MNNSQKLVRIRVKIGKPKRRSGVYIKSLYLDHRFASHRQENGAVINLKVFQKYQLEIGPTIYDGLDFKLIHVTK